MEGPPGIPADIPTKQSLHPRYLMPQPMFFPSGESQNHTEEWLAAEEQGLELKVE